MLQSEAAALEHYVEVLLRVRVEFVHPRQTRPSHAKNDDSKTASRSGLRPGELEEEVRVVEAHEAVPEAQIDSLRGSADCRGPADEDPVEGESRR